MNEPKPILPTSFSSLNSFETCPLKHYHIKIARTVDDPPGEAALWGSRVHEALEDYLNDGTELPTGCKQYRYLADMLLNKFDDAELLVEQELAVDRNFQPVEWTDPDAWFRGIIDVALLRGDTAYIFDWKTGKKKNSFDQLKMFAAMTTAYYPQVKTIHAAFIWLKVKEVTAQTYTSEEARMYWAELSPRVDRLEVALENDVWPARPSGLCRNWCPVGRKVCEHCGKA